MRGHPDQCFRWPRQCVGGGNMWWACIDDEPPDIVGEWVGFIHVYLLACWMFCRVVGFLVVLKKIKN